MGTENLPGGHEIKPAAESAADVHHHVRVAVVTVVGGDQHAIGWRDLFEGFSALKLDI